MKKNKIILIAFGLVLFVGCKDFLDINTSPNRPAEVEIEKILPSVFFETAKEHSIGFSRLGYVASVYTHQLVTRQGYDKYNLQGADYPVRVGWQNLYAGALKDANVLIEKGEEEKNYIYAGIAKIFKAYIFATMVDLWGDIPYTEFDDSNVDFPNFDKDEEIYQDIFVLLDEGIEDLNRTAGEGEFINKDVPEGDDLIYGGDVGKWKRAANSMKLRLYNVVRGTSLWNQSEMEQLISNPDDLIKSVAEGLLFYFGTSNNPENRHIAFVDEYVGNQVSLYCSPWFYEILNGENQNIFTGMQDPRIPYYFVNQLSGGESENPPEYRNGDFLSIYFGSDGTYRDATVRSSATLVGLYPVGGAYDAGEGGKLDASNVNGGDAPHKFLTYPDILFIRAEAALASIGGENARDLLEQGIDAAFEQVNLIVEKSKQPNIPKIGEDDITAYRDGVLAEFDAANDAKKLEIIITQKWIANFGSGIESYVDYRRTGYPVIFDPDAVNTVDGGPDGSGLVDVSAGRAYPRSFPYSSDELDRNSVAPPQKVNLGNAKVFWDNN